MNIPVEACSWDPRYQAIMFSMKMRLDSLGEFVTQKGQIETELIMANAGNEHSKTTMQFNKCN